MLRYHHYGKDLSRSRLWHEWDSVFEDSHRFPFRHGPYEAHKILLYLPRADQNERILTSFPREKKAPKFMTYDASGYTLFLQPMAWAKCGEYGIEN